MKKFTLLVSFLLLFTISGFAQKQKIYSVTNLEQASQEDLNIYLDKALKHKKNGKTVTIVGASALGVSIIYIIIDPAMALMSGLNVFYLGVPAIVTTTVGAIMLTKGSARVKRINKIKKTANYGIMIDLKPCVQYDLATQDFQPSVSVRISF